jgi:hypothetical protein
MWIPQTEEDILKAAQNATLRETMTFDAKREIPTKNIETAKDVSAMANSAGGVLLYGLGEDNNGQITILNPIALIGQRERIEQIIRTSVDEVPAFNVHAIPTTTNRSDGYVVVIVPPSERAPHMVIVKGERRFYGRGETGNYTLSQIEIARLYERRQQSESNLKPLLDQAIAQSPVPEDEAFSHLHIVGVPILRDDSLLTNALAAGETPRALLGELIGHVLNSVSMGGSYIPDFSQSTNWSRDAEGFLGRLWAPSDNDSRPNAHTLNVKVCFDGSGNLFCGRAAENTHDNYPAKFFFADLVAGNTTKFFALLGELYRRASYFGMVDLGVALTGLELCVPYETQSQFHWMPRYQGSSYRKACRVSAQILSGKPHEPAEKLLMPLISAIFEETYNPFQRGAV